MIWIQSIVCSLFFVANFAWQPKHFAVAIALNVLLAISCAVLLLTHSKTDDVDLARSRHGDAVGNAIVASLIVLYLASSFLKLNGSSTALWSSLADGEPPVAGVIAGTPKDIRSDEWLLHTPWIWSQANQQPAFPIVNRNVGNGVMPLITNLPVRHWTMIFRPQMWGFFVFDTERAFAFNWNFKWFGLLLGGFLFLRIIARENNFLALSGALLLLFASYIQWFFSNPTNLPEIISMLFFGLWAFDLLLRSSSRWVMLGAAVVLLVAVEQFVFCCYPRYQVALAYLAAALLAGGFMLRLKRPERPPLVGDRFRLSCMLATLFLAAGLLYQWSREIAPTFTEIRGLAYPGQVFSTGGGYPWVGFLAPFLEFSMTPEHHPPLLGNVCEASGFLFIAPLLAAGLIWDAWRQRADPILFMLVLFLGGTILFMVAGIPKWLAQVSGWSYVVSYRAILPLGVASIVGLVRQLALGPIPVPKRAVIRDIAMIAAAALFFLFLEVANRRLNDFATLPQLATAAIFFSTAGVFVWHRRVLPSCLLLLVPCIYSTGLINPISLGTPGLTQGAVFRWLSDVHEADPRARWMVVGPSSNRNCCLAQLVKATGADVLGGTRYGPDRGMVGVLDPHGHSANAHDRWARICFIASTEAEPVFMLLGEDYCEVRVPLRNELFQSLAVKYLVLVDQTEISPPSEFEQIGAQKGLVLLRRR